MKNFWEVLKLQPTTDIDAIKSARRSLIKDWHPDRASGSEQQALCNARCASINAAYDSAIAFANAWKPVEPDFDDDQHQPLTARLAASPTITSTLFFVLSRPIGSKSSWSTATPRTRLKSLSRN
jgi:hypothetical protein